MAASKTGSNEQPNFENILSKKPSSKLPYRIMWYKKLHTMGLRRSSGDRKQLFSFGDRGMSKESLIKVGKTLVNRMSAGEVSEADALQAAKQMMKGICS